MALSRWSGHDIHNGTLHDGLWIGQSTSAYSPAQISAWLSTIEFPRHFTEEDIAADRFPATLDNLYLLTRLQLVAFPYENTMMHYSANHEMDISAEGLYQRMVVGGRGSYCFGLNSLLFQMLRGLGYRAYSGAARINIATDLSGPPQYTALLHMVILVQPIEDSNITYLVDVGCGGSGLTRPILLSNAADNVIMGTSPTEKHRLTTGVHAGSSLQRSLTDSTAGDLEWRLEILHEKEHITQPAWGIVYSFSEAEYFPFDFESANFAVSKRPEGLFWNNVVCSKHFWIDSSEVGGCSSADDSLMERYMGRIGMEGGVVKRHVGSRSETIRTMSTVLEQVDALRDIFGLDIAPGDIGYIQGRAAELGKRIVSAVA